MSMPAYEPQPGHRNGARNGAGTGLIVGALILLLICCGGAAFAALTGNGGSNPVPTVTTPAAGRTTPAAAKAAEPKIGKPFRGGDFQFTVHGVKCGIESVGDQYFKREAHGSFCRLDVTVKNVTKKEHMFHADGSVTVTDTKGRQFSADGTAGAYGNDNAAGFLSEINPGNSERAYVFFDVPAGTYLDTATFDAGLFTTAADVTIKL